MGEQDGLQDVFRGVLGGGAASPFSETRYLKTSTEEAEGKAGESLNLGEGNKQGRRRRETIASDWAKKGRWEKGRILAVVVGSSGDGSSDSDTVDDLGLTDVLGEPSVVGGVVEPEGVQAESASQFC